MASRRKSRILAFQALYAWDATAAPQEDLMALPWLDASKKVAMEPESMAFTRLLLAGVIENIDAVDKAIAAHLQNWSLERLKKVDLAILRMSAYSLMFQKDMPPRITIDEAIEIAKEYGSDDSFRFINGVLDSILKSLPDGEALGSEGARSAECGAAL